MHLSLMLYIFLIQSIRGQFAIENLGTIYTYEDTKTVEFELDLTTYYRDITAIERETVKLVEMCEELKNLTQCSYHVKTNVENLKYIRYDASNMRSDLTRKKRWISLASTATGNLMKILMGSLTFLGVTWSISSTHEGSGNSNLTEQLLNINEILIEQANTSFNNAMFMHTKYRAYLEQVDILNGLCAKHRDETRRIIDILRGQIQSRIFDLTNRECFVNSIRHINNTLPNGVMLLGVNLNTLLKTSELSIQKNDTFIKMQLHIPIVDKNLINLYKIIPVPFSRDQNTYKLNINTIMFTTNSNNTLKTIPEEILKECKTFSKTYICNSLIK